MTTKDDFVLTVTDLIDRPGASRRVDLAMGVPEDLGLTLVEVCDPLRLAAVIESVVDGLLVRGRVEATMRLSCGRCLTDLEDAVEADVIELFAGAPSPAALDEEEAVEPGYEIREGTIDLDTLLRDALVPAAPYRPLCRTDCRGLCPGCGANRNTVDCICEDDDHDPRWAALEGLRLPPDGANS